MNLINLIRRDDETAFKELQTGVAEVVAETLGTKDAVSPDGESTLEPATSDVSVPDPDTSPVPADESVETLKDASDMERRPSRHAESRLAALASFDKLYDDAQLHLREIDTRLTEVTACQQLTRKFFGILDADIRRASDLELANAILIVEQKKLSEQLQEAERARHERDHAIELLHLREASLAQDNESARAALSATKMELVEAANTIARNEAELGDLIKTLSARSVDSERRARENELLREKQVSLSIDLDKSQKRETELGRKLEEASSTCANETARNAELLESFAKSEREVQRLQRAVEFAQMKHSEVEEAKRILEGEKDAEIARVHAEMSALRSEIQNLRSRLELAARENGEALSEIARLRFQLADAATEKQLADEKLMALAKEGETDKKSVLAANANLSQLALQQASDQIQLDVQKQQCEDLRTEIASLNARVKDLLPYERLYRVAKARRREPHIDGEVSSSATELPARRPPRGARRRADVAISADVQERQPTA
jgi:hypothetical protein